MNNGSISWPATGFRLRVWKMCIRDRGILATGFSLACLTLPARAQIAVRNQGYVPFSEEPINYRTQEVTDPVAKLQKLLDHGDVKLNYDPTHGYLKAVLEKLEVPLSTQTLVFSKTSFQYKKISPQAPRALYFNDDVYVGQVHDGKVLEFVSFDPMQGAIFYIMDERQSDHPVFQRAELDCTQCHIAAGTRGIPGVLLRSIFTTPTGTQAARTESFITSQQSPLKERWGGWYVTGTHGAQTHMGNAVSYTHLDVYKRQPLFRPTAVPCLPRPRFEDPHPQAEARGGP